MTGVSSINSSNIAFSGRKSTEKKSKKRIINHQPPNVKDAKMPKILKDKFVQAYGEDTPVTAELIADFAADKVMATTATLGSAAVLFAKARKSTYGLTEGLIKNFKNIVANSADDVVKSSAVRKFSAALKTTVRDIKSNNIQKEYEKIAKNSTEGASNLVDNFKKIFTGYATEFDNSSKLGKMVDGASDKVSGFAKKMGKDVNAKDLASKTKETLGNLGINRGAKVADTMAAGAGALAGAKGINSLADDKLEEDNVNIADKAKSAVNMVEKSANTLDRLASIMSAMGI